MTEILQDEARNETGKKKKKTQNTSTMHKLAHGSQITGILLFGTEFYSYIHSLPSLFSLISTQENTMKGANTYVY